MAELMPLSERDREYYAELVGSHAAELYRFAHRLCGPPETAEDLVQETFLEAWRSLGDLRDKRNVRAWLFQILRYRYAHFVRNSRRKITANTGMGDEQIPAAITEDPLESLAQRELLQHALDGLAQHYKEPFLMVFLQGLTCEETSRELRLPLGTVLSRVHRARKLLRAHLRRLEPNDLAVSTKLLPESHS